MSDPLCSYCKERNTKYCCVDCSLPTCNICSMEVSSESKGYSEELKKVGRCKDCGDVTITKNVIAAPPAKKVQKTIFASFGGAPGIKNNPKQFKKTVPSRTVTPETVEKWKSDLGDLFVPEWLEYAIDTNGKVKHLTCKFCKLFEDKIKTMDNYSNIFARGSTNFKKSAVSDHAKLSKPHAKACKLYFESKEVPLDVRAKKIANATGNQDIVSGLSTMDKKDLEKTKIKFEVAYFVAKNELPFTKYKEILELEKMHGVGVGDAYLTDIKCAEFIDYIGGDLKEKLVFDLSKAKFFGTLCDGSTDSATLEDEVVYLSYFDPQPVGSDEVKVKTTFIGVKSVRTATAEGVQEAIIDSYKGLSADLKIDDFEKKLIGFTSDGASVNRGHKQSVKTILKVKSPWIVFIWCIAHRLELALKDALTGTAFEDVDNMLLRLYYLYKKAPKKLRQLKELHDAYKEGMGFEEGGFRPKKSNGTRWIAHKLSAMKMCLDKWGLYIQHLESLCEDKTIPTKDRAKLKGYLKSWKNAKMPFLLSMCIDLLEIPAQLSICMQSDKIDTVNAMNYLSKAKQRLELFERKEFEKLPHVKYVISKVSCDDGKYFLHDIELKNYETSKQFVKDRKNDFLDRVRECIVERLEEEAESEKIFKYVPIILNCEGWERKVELDGETIDDNEFADDAIVFLLNHFETPLKSAGLTASEADVVNQWYSLLEYAREYLSLSATSYLCTWRKIFSSPRCKNWRDVLILIELLFTIPVCNAKLERMFSKLKYAKTDFRCSLSTKRLEHLLRIVESGPDVKNYDVLPAIAKWASDKNRRPSEQKPKVYKKRTEKKRKISSLSDLSDVSSDSTHEVLQEDQDESSELQSLFSEDEL